MSFGADLQGKKSHEAYLRLQDAEIRFLDNVKRCLNVRIDTDKKYSASLHAFVQQAQKVDLSEHQQYDSSFRAWDAIIQQTSKYVEILKKNTEELGCKTMEKISNLISDKKAARKQYLDDRNRLEQEFTKVQDEVQKQKQEYSKAVERLKGDKAKYNDLQLKGKPAKVEDAKNRFTKSTGKLHRVHNEYVLSLREVVSHQNSYLTRTLPTILDYHQTKFELLGDQCKDILLDYQRMTDYSTEDFCDIFRQIEVSVSKINPDGDTSDFLLEVRTDPLPSSTLEYDNRLLDDCETLLTENEIAVDNETVEALNSRLSVIETELSKVTNSLEEKEASLTELSSTVKNLQKYTDEDTKALNLEYISKRKDLENLRREVTEFYAKRDTLQVLCDAIKTPLEATGDNVPSALSINSDSTADVSANSTTSASGGGGGGGLKGLKSKISGVRKKFNHEKEDTQRASSYEEATIDSTSNGPRISTSEGNGLSDVSTLPLEEEEWFHGVLPREEVQRLLCKDGDYLVRESKNRKTNETQYVLSVYWQGHRHFIIQYGEGGWRFEGASYPTVSELLQNQHKSGTPVTTKSQAILYNPILREQWQLRNDDIALEMKIGNGNFGEVYRGVYKPRSMTVAVKTCKDTLSEDQRKKFLQEGRILKQYDHPNIVRFIGIAAQRQPVMIVMEYVSGGALLNYLRKHGKAQSKKTLTKMCEDAANGMAYLESKNCIHRDLAARNCLVGENNVVKISDFGMSREEEEYTVSDGLKQIPIKWTAPEALLYGKYTSLCDVWSFGILMWEVFSGGLTPYQGMTNAESREKVDTGYRMPAPQGTPDDVYTLMCSCWERNPSKRPHFKDIYSKLKSIGLHL